MARQFYFVSLAYYGHQVLKCAGFGAEDIVHREFYLPFFQQYGRGCVTPQAEAEKRGPYTVLILDDCPSDLVTLDGRAITLPDALKQYKRH